MRRYPPRPGTLRNHMAAAVARAVLIVVIIAGVWWILEGARILGQHLQNVGG